jgi:glycosyltransferase involved in cell wall biosynthesis
MKIGVLHPTINACGGAELVAVNILDCVKKVGHDTILLTNEKIDQERLQNFFRRRANVDSQIVFPFEFFQTTNPHNIYTDFVRALILKAKCDVLVDTYSNGLLPGSSVVYIHYPLSGRIPLPESKKDYIAKLKRTYYTPYSLYERTKIKQNNIVFFANSAYTMKAIKKFMGIEPVVLYPPVADEFFVKDCCCDRLNTVISIGRISPEKKFTLIPKIAKLTDKRINFIIIGIKSSALELKRIRELIVVNGVSARVRIVTDLSREKILGILRSSKVFLHTAVGEHFGISIAEAMASGCVVICHDSGGPKEFVPSQFRFDKVEKAAELINKAVNEWSPKMSHEISLLAERFREQNFSKLFAETFCSYLNRL